MTPREEYRIGVKVGRMYAPDRTPEWYLGFCTGLWLGSWQAWLRACRQAVT